MNQLFLATESPTIHVKVKRVALSDPPFPSVRLDLDKKHSIPGCLDSGAFLLLMNKDKLSPVPL